MHKAMTMTQAARQAIKALARQAMAGRRGYHIEWYTGPRYVRPMAVVVSHDVVPHAVSYYVRDDGTVGVWA